jgi:hypothetical protein
MNKSEKSFWKKKKKKKKKRKHLSKDLEKKKKKGLSYFFHIFLRNQAYDSSNLHLSSFNALLY